MENYIQLKKDNIIRIGIKDSEGNILKEHLEFDLEDIDLPMRLNRMEIEHTKNLNYLKMQMSIIEKKPDKKGKYFLSLREEETLKLLKEFYRREMDALDLFLGKGMCKVLLNGREPYFEMYNDFADILKPVLPLLQKNYTEIMADIKNKYSNNKDGNVIE